MESFDELYYREPYARAFDATVLRCDPSPDEDPGSWKVVLDQSAFYPLGGGQPGDRGRLLPLDKDGNPQLLQLVPEDDGAESQQAESQQADEDETHQDNPQQDKLQQDESQQHVRTLSQQEDSAAVASEEHARQRTASEQDQPGPELPEEAPRYVSIRVLDTTKEGDEVIHHTDAPLEPGTRVHGILDWTWRRDNMEAHTGEHIVSGIVHQLYGYENVGFHMGERCIEVDFDGILTPEQALDVEQRANAAVREDLPVEALIPSSSELQAMDYRSKKELEGPVRIVSIAGVDACACCGTHVSTTGQVGLIKILRVTSKKKRTRLELLCGRRALESCEAEMHELREVSNFLSVGDEEALEAVQRLSAEKDALKHELKQARHTLIDQEIEALASQKEQKAPTVGNVLVRLMKDADIDEMRYFCEQATAKGVAPICAALSPAQLAANKTEEVPRLNYVIASSETDLRPACKELNARLGGRGGGKPQMVQGSYAASTDDAQAALQDVLGAIE